MNKKTKLWIFLIFMVVVIGGGFVFALMIPRNAVKKTGYKTKNNPSYVDSVLEAKKKSKKGSE